VKDRKSSFEDLLGVFYGLLLDLLELNAGLRSPLLRNPNLTKELEALARTVDTAWIRQAMAGMDWLAGGLRRNLNRQLGLDSLAVSLASNHKNFQAHQ
jgi:hypothetical protein